MGKGSGGGGGGGKGRSAKGGGGGSGGGSSQTLSPTQQSQADQLTERFRTVSPAEQQKQIDSATKRYSDQIQSAEKNIARSEELISKGNEYLRTTTNIPDRPFTTSVSREREAIKKQQDIITVAKDNLKVVNAVKKKLGL